MVSESLPTVIRAFRASDEQAVVELWRTVFPENPPWNVPADDARRKLLVQSDLFLVAEWDAQVVGTAMAGFDGHRGWLHLVAVLPEYRRRGVGGALLFEAEHRLAALGCPKVNLQIRASNHEVVAFYEQLGYSVEERISMGKQLPGPLRAWNDDALLNAFEDTSYPLEEFTHRAHIRVAYIYLSQLKLKEAIARMRVGLHAFLAAHGVEQGPESGYHETVTQAFMRLIHAAITRGGPFADSWDFCRRHPELLEKRVLLLFYSTDRICSPEARQRFVEPDLAPLRMPSST